MKPSSNANPASTQQLFNYGNLSVNSNSFSVIRTTNSQIAVNVGFSTTAINSTRSVNNTLWNHVGVVVLPPNNNTSAGLGTMRNILIYLNGDNVSNTAAWSTTTINTTKSSNGLADWITIGRANNTGANFFGGYIDDIRLYDVALTPQEIRGIYYNSSNYRYITNS